MLTVTPQTLYVNVYSEIERYGGAEEGGWYYWEGTPMWTAKGICLCLDSKHEEHCPISGYIQTAQAIVSGVKEGYLESYTIQDAETPEYRNEGIYGRRTLKLELKSAQAYPQERPYYQ